MRLSLLSFLLLLAVAVRAQTPTQANKQLFDRTVDELNFHTFEAVYDKHFPRQTYPATLRTAAARKQFTQFEGNAALEKLFQNYNDGAERYKTRFGGGSLAQPEFEKQLNGIVLDRNFEFFIRGLPRDEKTALVRQQKQVIKKAVAQFNASGETTAPPATETDEQPLASAPLTTHGPAPGEAATLATTDDNGDDVATTPAGPVLRGDAPAPASGGPGWVGYLTLLSSLASLALLLYVARAVLPDVRRLRARVRALEAGQAAAPGASAEDGYTTDDAEETPATSRTSAFFKSLRPPKGMVRDRYDEDDEEEETDEADEEADEPDDAPFRPS